MKHRLSHINLHLMNHIIADLAAFQTDREGLH